MPLSPRRTRPSSFWEQSADLSLVLSSASGAVKSTDRFVQYFDLQMTLGEPLEKILEVEIERILRGGVGLAHAEGLTLFVSLAAPGDVVCVEINRVHGKVAFASIKEIIKPSPVRVEPPCKYFGRCGGCDFQQLNYEAQLKAKVEMVRDCLRRIGGIENPPDFQVTPAPNQWRYRSRAQWQYDSIRKRLGYFEAGSQRVCDVVDCAVLAPELQQTLSGLRAGMRD